MSERERGGERAAEKQTERGSRKKNTKYKKERLLRQEDRQQRTRERESGKRLPTPSTTRHPTSVFIKRIVSINPGVEAFISPCRCLMSWGPSIFWCWRLWGLAGLGKAGRLSERQLSDYSPAERSRYRWNDLSSIASSIPFFLPPLSHQSQQSPRFIFIWHLNTATGYMFDM